jgi:hypothetical protein
MADPAAPGEGEELDGSVPHPTRTASNGSKAVQAAMPAGLLHPTAPCGLLELRQDSNIPRREAYFGVMFPDPNDCFQASEFGNHRPRIPTIHKFRFEHQYRQSQ